MKWGHDRIWARHPAVTKGNDKTRGQRAADLMKAILATWTALICVLVFIFFWISLNSHLTSGHHFDPTPFIELNLCLSCFAALQCFVLLIANKRGEQVAAELAQHDHEMLEQNTVLTRQTHENTEAIAEVHRHVTAICDHLGLRAGIAEPSTPTSEST